MDEICFQEKTFWEKKKMFVTRIVFKSLLPQSSWEPGLWYGLAVYYTSLTLNNHEKAVFENIVEDKYVRLNNI